MPPVAAPVTDPFLQYARPDNDVVQVGTIATAQAGGPSSLITWNPSDLPEVPGWVTDIEVNATIPISVTVPANSTATVSPYAPYCLLALNMLLAGAAPWPTGTSLVPFWLDEITSRRAYDPSMAQISGLAAQQAYSPTAYGFSLNGITPGGTIVNSGTAALTNNYTLVFNARIRLQRRRDRMFGTFPLGDPENRPSMSAYLLPLVGNNPEVNLIQDTASKGITAQTNGAGTVTLTYVNRQLDVLPAGVVSVPEPVVGMGLNVSSVTTSIQNAGQITPVTHRIAQVYEKIHHLLVNSDVAQDADYFGLWLNGQQQSARFEYDSAKNNFNTYYLDVQSRYGRFLPKGHYLADFVSGYFPEVPQATPYDALMTPDVALAQALGIAATPAMRTALRVPASTTMSGAYVRTYSFGLVPVPY